MIVIRAAKKCLTSFAICMRVPLTCYRRIFFLHIYKIKNNMLPNVVLRVYHGLLYFRIVARLQVAGINVLSFMPTRRVMLPLGRYSLNSHMRNYIMCMYLARHRLSTKSEVHAENMDRNLFAIVINPRFLLRPYSRN
jgi:hypothetical protein